MVKLERLIELPFTIREIRDNELAVFIEDHIKRCIRHASIQRAEDIEETRIKLSEYKVLLTEIESLTLKRKENTAIIKATVKDIKEFFRSMGNFIVFTYSKESDEYQKLFPNGLTEISSLNNGNLKNMILRVKEFLSNHEENEVFLNQKTNYIEIQKTLQKSLDYQETLHKKLPQLIQEKNDLKELLIRFFKRNICSAYVLSFDKPDNVFMLFNNKIGSKSISNSN